MSPTAAPPAPGPTPPTGPEVELAPWPDESHIVTEDGKPVDGIYSEKQMRLLTEPLYANWPGPGTGQRFIATANVGLFYLPDEPPLVPDVLLSLNVTPPDEFYSKPNRSYFMWRYRKPPDVVIEVVSNKEGGEDTTKSPIYARWGVPYYVVHDPEDLLGGGTLRQFELVAGRYRPISPGWLENVGLGLTLWHGSFEGWDTIWLRWCDHKGDVVPTGAERAEVERARADKLLALLREKGIDPGEL